MHQNGEYSRSHSHRIPDVRRRRYNLRTIQTVPNFARNIYDLQTSRHACGHCSTPLTSSPLIVPCAASTSSTPCPVRFCSRLCLSRSNRTHPLLCASRNPASAPLLHLARRSEWMALHALSQLTARVLLTFQQDEKAFTEDWAIVRAFAHLGMEERAKSGGCVSLSMRPVFSKAWLTVH